jgi:hypothetical protein
MQRQYSNLTFELLRSTPLYGWSRDSSVGIATGYGLNDRRVGVRVSVKARSFSSPRCPDRLWGPPSLLSNGYRGVKRQGREADHSPTTSAEVKKMWIYISTPSLRGIVLLCMELVHASPSLLSSRTSWKTNALNDVWRNAQSPTLELSRMTQTNSSEQ